MLHFTPLFFYPPLHIMSPKTNFDTPKRLKERQLKKKEIKAKKGTTKLVLKNVFCNDISQHQFQYMLF